MKYIKSLILLYASYEMWQIPADLWHKLSIVCGVLAIVNIIEALINRKEK